VEKQSMYYIRVVQPDNTIDVAIAFYTVVPTEHRHSISHMQL